MRQLKNNIKTLDPRCPIKNYELKVRSAFVKINGDFLSVSTSQERDETLYLIVSTVSGASLEIPVNIKITRDEKAKM